MSGASRSVLLLAVLALACQKRAHDEPPPPVAPPPLVEPPAAESPPVSEPQRQTFVAGKLPYE